MATDIWNECDITEGGEKHSETNGSYNHPDHEHCEKDYAQDSPDTEQDSNQNDGGC